jgi:hypothetical protein
MLLERASVAETDYQVRDRVRRNAGPAVDAFSFSDFRFLPGASVVFNTGGEAARSVLIPPRSLRPCDFNR